MSHPIPSFPHDRLDAYHVALDLLERVHALCERIPRGHRTLADQMLRAASSTLLQIAEGANRRARGDKRQRYSTARGEVGECAAAIEAAVALRLIPHSDAHAARCIAARVGAMLTGLVRRFA